MDYGPVVPESERASTGIVRWSRPLQGGASELHPTYPGVLTRTRYAPPIAAWVPSRESETILAREKQMAHDHGYEYQVRIIHEDGTEELSGWMNGEEQLVRAMAAVHGTRQSLLASGTKRSLSRLLQHGTDNHSGMSHYGFLSPRHRPHDSQYRTGNQ
jgi:hypothetical protein